MDGVELLGWSAAALTLTAFTMRDLRVLRAAAVGASLCFIAYGAATSAWPVLALHLVLLPLNLQRLHEARRRPADGPGRRPARHAARPWSRAAGLLLLPLLLAMLSTGSAPASAAQPTYADRMHARALESFRAGRFPEAYGRFVELANLGHPASARYALWMCEQGLPLFAKDWDCLPDEAIAWAAAAREAPSRGVPGTAAPRPTSNRQSTGR